MNSELQLVIFIIIIIGYFERHEKYSEIY